jgi:hypothetical protein
LTYNPEPDGAAVEPCAAKAVAEHDTTTRPAANPVAMDGSVMEAFLSACDAGPLAPAGSISRTSRGDPTLASGILS